jgi:hypothetical protein
MSDAEFSVYLGGGLYMNSQGVLSHGPEPGKPVYQTPGGGLPIQPDALAKAFQGIAKALPDKDDPKSREKFDKILDGIGMAAADKENLIGVLQSVGAVASVIGSVVPVAGAALAVLTLLLGLFKNGPSALELLISRRFDELERKIKALEIQIQQRDLRNQRNAISAALAALANYVVELKNTPPDQATLLQRQQDVRNQVDAAGLAVRNLLDSSTWLASFDRNEYQHVWPWIAHRLFTLPTIGGIQPAVYPPQGANHFDHRLMVPLVMFAVTGYLTVLRAAAPEFRSTRQHREDLWDFAVTLEILVENMRREGLARTVYTAADFDGGAAGGIPWGLSPEEVVDLFGLAPYLAPDSTRFAVGALDLWAHNDGYFTPQFSASAIQFPGPENAKQGLINVRWIPPARLDRYEEIVPSLGWEPANQPPKTQRRYRIANPDECAKAANAVAEQNYVDLLYSSGYFNLIHLIATLRNEATDPDRSQTVQSDAWLRCKPGTAVDVTVESQPILLTGVISAAAERQPQEYKATTWFTTQPLGRERKLTYRVWLRTLSANFSAASGSWRSEQQYTDYHQVGYTNDPERPGFKKLFTSTGVPLSQLKIAEGTSTAESRESSGTAVLQAVTFDWWMPVAPLGYTKIVSEEILKQASFRATGFEVASESAGGPKTSPAVPAPLPQTLPIGVVRDVTGIRDDIKFSDLFGWEDGTEPVKGQRRLAALGEVQLDYTLHWQADRLTVSLKNNRPTDRNYVVYVVVEETLGSGEVLHTVERIPITGQLTFVPQSFFDQEAEAQAKMARFFRDFAAHYAKSLRDIPRPAGPGDPDEWHIDGLLGLDRKIIAGDPVLRELQLGILSAPQDFERFVTLALRHPPAIRVLRQLLTETGVSETALLTMLESLHLDQSAMGSTGWAMEDEGGG